MQFHAKPTQCTFLLCITLLLLGACTPGSPTEILSPLPTTVSPLTSPLSPISPIPVPPDTAPPPNSASADTLPWDEAEKLIMEGKVAQVFQTHALEVTLYLKDGQIVTTIEPQIDEVFKVVQSCGDACSGISLATE